MSSVVHIVQNMSPGGIEALALDLVRVLPGTHHLVSLEGRSDDLIKRWPRLSQVEKNFTALSKTPGMSPACAHRLARVLRRAGANLIVTHHIGPLLYGAVASAITGRLRVVHVEHDAWHLEDDGRLRLFNWLLRLVAPTVVAVSPRIADNLRTVTSHRNIRLITNGVDLKRFSGARLSARRDLGLGPRDLVIGSIGRLEAVKGHDILLAAIGVMNTDAQLIIGGDGSQREALAAQARGLGISGRVRFLGTVNAPERLYPAFDVFCLPSRNEGLPLALLEAQAAGVPVVATDVGDVSSAVCPASGRLVKAEDPFALAVALEVALTNRVSVTPVEFIQNNFDWTETVRAYSDVIRGVQ